jgi:hypothetical protein
MLLNYDNFYNWYLRNTLTLPNSNQFKVFFYKLDRTGLNSYIIQDDIVSKCITIENKTVYLSYNTRNI